MLNTSRGRYWIWRCLFAYLLLSQLNSSSASELRPSYGADAVPSAPGQPCELLGRLGRSPFESTRWTHRTLCSSLCSELPALEQPNQPEQEQKGDWNVLAPAQVSAQLLCGLSAAHIWPGQRWHHFSMTGFTQGAAKYNADQTILFF